MSLTETFDTAPPAAQSAPLDPAAEDFALEIERALAGARPDALSDGGMRRLMTALGKLYVAKAEAADDEELAPVDRDALTATDTALLVCALLRAADLNMLDLAMWFARGEPSGRTGRSS